MMSVRLLCHDNTPTPDRALKLKHWEASPIPVFFGHAVNSLVWWPEVIQPLTIDTSRPFCTS